MNEKALTLQRIGEIEFQAGFMLVLSVEMSSDIMTPNFMLCSFSLWGRNSTNFGPHRTGYNYVLALLCSHGQLSLFLRTHFSYL